MSDHNDDDTQYLRSSMGSILKSDGIETSVMADFGDHEVYLVEEAACSICLVDFEHGDEIQRNASCCSPGLLCDHIFHPICISTWIQDNSDCPNCRTPFLVVPSDTN